MDSRNSLPGSAHANKGDTAYVPLFVSRLDADSEPSCNSITVIESMQNEVSRSAK